MSLVALVFARLSSVLNQRERQCLKEIVFSFQASYPGALGTSPPKDSSYLSQVQSAEPHDTVLNMSTSGSGYNPKASLGQSPQPLIKSIKGELFRLSQGTSRKTPITEL